MESNPQLINTLAVVVLGAVVGGVAASIIRIPIILGYILSGIVLGAFRDEIGLQVSAISGTAEFGVALLLFIVGMEVSFQDLANRLAAVGAPLQILVTLGLGALLARSLGFEMVPSLIAGYAGALSSTAVALKLLEARNHIGSNLGSAVLAYALVQDLSLVLALALLPLSVGAASLGGAAAQVGWSLALVAALWAASTRIVPMMLRAISRTRSRELFILSALGLCFAAAVIADKIGISIAVGAFLAGMTLSRSEFRHQVIAESIPFRELFGSFFFVSLGMLIDLQFLLEHWLPVLSLTVMILLGKTLIIGLLTQMLGFHPRVAVSTGLALSQIGEFSFVMANSALKLDVIPRELYDLILSATAMTLLLSPLLFAALDPIAERLSRRVNFGRLISFVEPPGEDTSGHAILCGYGRVGRRICRLMKELNLHVVVVDFDARALRSACEHAYATVFGDASNPEILKRCQAEKAQLAILAMPDRFTTVLTAKHVRNLNPNIAIVARAHSPGSADELETQGVNAAVVAEEETAKAMVRECLVLTGIQVGKAEESVEDAPSARGHAGFD